MLSRSLIPQKSILPMKRYLLLLFSALVIIACSDNNQRVFRCGRVIVSSIPDEEKTIVPISSFSGSVLDGTFGLNCIIDSTVILNIHDETHCYRAVNLVDNRYVDFLNYGRGPDEIITGYFSGVRTINDTVLIDISGINERVFYSIDYKATMEEGKTVVKERYGILPNSMASFLIGEEILSEVIYDKDFISLKQYGKTDQSLIRTVQLYGDDSYLLECEPILGSVKRVKPDGTLMSMAMMDFDEVNIFDIKGEDHLSVSISGKTKDNNILRNYHLFEKESDWIYYWGGSVTDDSIYALYLDCDLEKIEEAIPVIHVFSWDGQLKAIYHLNECLRSIIVSDDGKSLYGLSWDEVIYKYDLG